MALHSRGNNFGNLGREGGYEFLEQPSASNRTSGPHATSISMPQLNREFRERSEAIQRGGQQASGNYQKSIRNDDVRGSNLGVVTEQKWASTSNIKDSQRYLQWRRLPDAERTDAIQRGGQQASGYYHKSIKNDDVRDSNLGVVAEEISASTSNRYPQDAAHARMQMHPIQRGKAQASGSFKRSIPNDDDGRLDRLPLHHRRPDSSQRPFSYVNPGMLQADGEPERDQRTENYYWSSRQDDDDVLPVNQLGLAPTVQQQNFLDSDHNLANSKVLDRVFEWEPTSVDQTNTYLNGAIPSQVRRDGESPGAVGRDQTQRPDLLLQPRTLEDQFPEFVNSNAAAAWDGLDDQQLDTVAPGQTSTPVPPGTFLYQEPSDVPASDVNKEKRSNRNANVLLAAVVVLCFLLTAAVIVILVVAV